MSRIYFTSLAVVGMALSGFSAGAFAQGVLVDVRVGQAIRLPRPIPIPPRTIPQPPSSYKIDSIEVNAKLNDQVARTGVAIVRKHRQHADGSELHVSLAL